MERGDHADKAMGGLCVDALQGSQRSRGRGESGQRRMARRGQQPVARGHPDDRLHPAAELSCSRDRPTAASRSWIRTLMHSQIQVFARLLHAIETMTAGQLKGGA